ncbi:probable LIM domain-containing serine/threonine-protein kinase DDB_G0286997 isoform X2 [Panonychus citri]|uniref:probable LIM domain-containing serine/threonine-protein kinase DDB_G0286997 isoform X2 n=1 Tax=Panonychus citri TaxID=50023 RepID=UPI0023078FED|nr:probable LIM domain-containing serine/threonine-protein kinase DDB_G0286997 isoform X2 [Panonychus citri]
MAFINVAEWSPQNVVNWLQGLEDSILPYVAFFLNNNINGCRLLLLSCDDLENLNVTKVGHQEIILEAVEHLKHLHYNFCSETLQMLALRLGCKSRSLYNLLKQEKPDDSGFSKSSDRVTTKTLSGVCDILTSVKLFVSWIDRYPFGGHEEYISMRRRICKLSIELASTAQRDQFVEKPNEVIKENCCTFAEMCDRIVQELNDPLAIQPASLEVITIKKRAEEDVFWGLHFSSTFSGIHIVEKVDHGSPFHRGRIEEGSEIVQINYQTVVGWQLKKVFNSVKDYSTEITITIKKRPRHSNNQITVLKPYKIVNRKVKGSSNRLRNASTATTTSLNGNSDNDSDQDSLKERKSLPKSPISQVMPRRPRGVARRRASISGSSPTTIIAPVRIEDLYDRRDMILSRTVSHDEGKHQFSLMTIKSKLSPGTSCESCCSNSSGKFIPPHKSSSTSQVPYAKVHPLLNRESNFHGTMKPPSPHYVNPAPALRPKQPQVPPPPPCSSPPSLLSHQNQHLSSQIQQKQIHQSTIKSTKQIAPLNTELEDNPAFHEYQPPPSPKPIPPPTPPIIKQRILEARAQLNNVTLPRRKSDEDRAIELVNRLSTAATLKQNQQQQQQDPPSPSPSPPTPPPPTAPRNSTSQSISALIKPQPPPPPRVVGVARSMQTFVKEPTKSRRSPTLSDSSSSDYSKSSNKSDTGEETKDNDKQKTKPVVPQKSLKVQQLMN